MKNPPNIKDVRIIDTLIVDIDWSTGETLRIDLSGCTNPPFDVLCNPDFFRR